LRSKGRSRSWCGYRDGHHRSSITTTRGGDRFRHRVRLRPTLRRSWAFIYIYIILNRQPSIPAMVRFAIMVDVRAPFRFFEQELRRRECRSRNPASRHFAPVPRAMKVSHLSRPRSTSASSGKQTSEIIGGPRFACERCTGKRVSVIACKTTSASRYARSRLNAARRSGLTLGRVALLTHRGRPHECPRPAGSARAAGPKSNGSRKPRAIRNRKWRPSLSWL